MRKIRWFIFRYSVPVLLLIASLNTFAQEWSSFCDDSREDYFCLPVGSQKANASTEADYLKDTQLIQKMYAARIQAKFARPLVIENLWSSPFFGGGTHLQDSKAQILLLGGMYRFKENHGLAFITALCHEIGHFLAPGLRQDFENDKWSALEGYADHFAAVECLPEIFSKNPDRFYKSSDLDLAIQGICQNHRVCQNVAQAGYDMVRLMYPMASPPEPALVLKRGVAPKAQELNRSYPSLQCRLESFLNAAQCLRQGLKPDQCHPADCWAP